MGISVPDARSVVDASRHDSHKSLAHLNFGMRSILSHPRVRSNLIAIRKAAFDGRTHVFRVRACARAEATDLNTTMIDGVTFLTVQRFNHLIWRSQCWH